VSIVTCTQCACNDVLLKFKSDRMTNGGDNIYMRNETLPRFSKSQVLASAQRWLQKAKTLLFF